MLKLQYNLDVMAIITTVMYKYIINIITLANDLLSTCFTEWTLLGIIISIPNQIQLCNNSSGISSTCHHYERCEITELVLHKFQVLVEFNCLMLLSITTLGHDLFCEFVCFLRCIHRISWNDPSTCVYYVEGIFLT